MGRAENVPELGLRRRAVRLDVQREAELEQLFPFLPVHGVVIASDGDPAASAIRCSIREAPKDRTTTTAASSGLLSSRISSTASISCTLRR